MSVTFRGAAASAPCPCGSTRPYAACCAPLHLGHEVAGTAERLMRSRYAAYALGEVAYLRRTWHPSTRPRRLDLDPSLVWTGLEVARSEEHGDDGVVEFTARYAVGGTSGAMHEVSEFVRVDGRWLYVGPQPQPSVAEAQPAVPSP